MTTDASVSEARAAVERKLAGLESSGEELWVSDLFAAARAAGAPLREAEQLAVDSAADGARQEGWAEWEEIPDQTEIALRLKSALATDTLRHDLEDFLTFYFRASAPEVYRHAALALGRHSWQNERCEDYLTQYASVAGVDWYGPIALNGERSRRRLLLAAVERYVHTPPGETRPSFPIVEFESVGAERAPADVAALCVAAERVVGILDDPARLESCWSVVTGIERQLGRRGSQRGLIRAWGDLFRALADRDRERASSAWSAAAGSFSARRDGDFAGHLATAWELDALVSLAVEQWERERVPGLEELGAVFDSPALRWLVRVREWQWRRRRTGESSWPWGREVPKEVDGVVGRFAESVVFEVADGASYRDAVQEWVAETIDTLAGTGRWWRASAKGRALRTFLALDAVRYRTPPRRNIEKLLEASDISRTADAGSETHRTQALEGVPWNGFHDLLWYIYIIEGAPRAFPVESDWFTTITNADRLLGFVRADQSIRDADMLVDGVEHFLRLEMASDPEFDHRHFLFRFAARKPELNVVRELADRTRDRTYRLESGESVSLHAAVESLADEFDPDERGARTRDRSDGWFPELHHVRRALLSTVETSTFADAVEAFADQLDPRLPDPAVSEGRGLVDLVARLAAGRGDVLLDSTTGRERVERERFLHEVTEHTRVLRTSVARIFDDPEADLSEMYRAIRNIVGALRDLEDWLAPSVPPVDRQLIGEVVAALVDRALEWGQLLERKVGVRLKAGDIPSDEALEALFREILDAETEYLTRSDRVRLFRVGFELVERSSSLQMEGAGSEHLREEVRWDFERDVLGAVARAADMDALDEPAIEFLVDHWEQLAEAAMDAQAEPNVVDLVEDDALHPLLVRACDTPTGERLEAWLMDRYHVRSLATQVAADTSGESRTLGSWGRAVGRLANYYGHVWLALLVGAVMLLDFGDAWVEMARTGDVAGIATTFAIGLGGTFLYLLVDISRKTQTTFERGVESLALSRLVRATVFLAICFGYALAVTTGLWYLFSGTDVVVHGEGATLHILVWTGFALFVGIFFGLLSEGA